MLPRVSPWLVRQSLKADLPAPRTILLCFPFSGGASTAYRTWTRPLGPSIEVVPVELPGRGTRFREPLLRSMEELLSAVTAAILATFPDDPGAPRLALFGHSMGATVAFECARRLTAAGRPPSSLVVSGRTLRSRAQRLFEQNDTDLVASLRALGGTPEEVLANPEVTALMLPIVRADSEVLAGYTYVEGPLLSVPVLAITGDHDRLAPPEGMPAWAEVTTAATKVTVLPGGHFYWTDPHPLHAALRAFV